MANLTRLRDEHKLLEAISRRLSEVLAQDLPPPPSELYMLRQELASALIRHLKAEDWVLYPRLLASPDKGISETARSFSDEMGGLATEFKTHSERWGSFAIQEDWNGYRAETAIILETLARRVDRENRELYPLLEATEHLPLGVEA